MCTQFITPNREYLGKLYPPFNTLLQVSANEKNRCQVNDSLRWDDTITLAIYIRLPKDLVKQIMLYNCTTAPNKFEIHYYTQTFQSKQGATISVVYYVRLSNGESRLEFDFSVPKLVLGNNYQTIPVGTDVLEIIRQEFEPIFNLFGMTCPNLLNFFIKRMDASHNFPIQQSILRDIYMKIAKSQNISRHNRNVYQNCGKRRHKKKSDDGVQSLSNQGDNGVSYTTNDHAIKLYSKYDECGKAESIDILRLEDSNLSAERVGKILGVKNPKLRDLRKEPLIDLLKNDLSLLNLDRKHECKPNWTDFLDLLPPRIRGGIIYFLETKRDNPGLSTKAIANKMGCTPQTVNKYIRICKEYNLGDLIDNVKNEPGYAVPPLLIQDITQDRETILKVENIVSELCSNTLPPQNLAKVNLPKEEKLTSAGVSDAKMTIGAPQKPEKDEYCEKIYDLAPLRMFSWELNCYIALMNRHTHCTAYLS